jgi:hypothetical protein
MSTYGGGQGTSGRITQISRSGYLDRRCNETAMTAVRLLLSQQSHDLEQGMPDPSFAQPNQPRKQVSKRSQVIRISILLVVLAGVLVVVYFGTRNQVTNAEVGQCVERTGDDSLSLVECADAAAQYKVVGRKEDLQQYGNINVCDEFDGATDRYWQGEQGEEGFFLCLAPVTRP